jgi:hypothetical protein
MLPCEVDILTPPRDDAYDHTSEHSVRGRGFAGRRAAVRPDAHRRSDPGPAQRIQVFDNNGGFKSEIANWRVQKIRLK